MIRRKSPSSPHVAAKIVPRLWWLVAAAAAAFVIWMASVRIDRIDYLTELLSWSARAPEIDPDSPTGYEEGQRRLIVPGHHNPSYGWIAQTQLALAEGKWRLRHVDYDNAPEGRATHATAPYRWYLASLAWADQLASDRSLGRAVEYAARYANPLLQLVILLSVAVFTARHFGWLASCMATISVVALFPLGGNFQAGAPDHHTLVWLCILWSVLPLLAVASEPGAGERRRIGSPRGWFVAAGVFSGLGMWADARVQGPIIVGIALGAIGHALLAPRQGESSAEATLPWRAWGIAAAVTCLLGYVVEYAPSNIEWAIRSIHPAHALAILGLGEILTRARKWRLVGRSAWDAQAVAFTSLALLAVATLPLVAWLTESSGGLGKDPFSDELANHPAGTFAKSTGSWVSRDGFDHSVWATLLPTLILVGALIAIAYPKMRPSARAALALACGPALVALVLAAQQLRWWNMFDVALIPAVILLFRRERERPAPSSFQWAGAAGYFLILIPGLVLSARVDTNAERDLEGQEVQAALERDLAYWLAREADISKPIVFSTPGLSETLHFYGGIRGIVSHSWENESGFSAATRIASASSWAESSALLTGREVSYIVLPSWDASLESLVRLGRHTPAGAATPSDTLVHAVQNWGLAPWMRPVPYSIPKTTGFEDFSTVVLSVEGEQEEAYAAARLADYFLELGMMMEATIMREQLALYPRDLAALTMHAQISFALRDAAKFGETLETLLPYLSRRSARSLPTDRRVSLTILLIQAKRMEEAREQLRIVMDQMDSDSIRQLTTGARVRLLAMTKMLGVDFPDPALRAEVMKLIPPGVQDKLTGEG